MSWAIAAWRIITNPMAMVMVAAAAMIGHGIGYTKGARYGADTTKINYELRLVGEREAATKRVSEALEAGRRLAPTPHPGPALRRLCNADPSCRDRGGQ